MVGILVLHPALYFLYGHWHSLADPWHPGTSFGTQVDLWLNTPALYFHNVNFMPLSWHHYVTMNALSSSATILSGVLVGELLRSSLASLVKIAILGLTGIGCLYLGLAMMPFIPMVKKIWTSTFAIYAGGWTLILMAGFYLAVDVLRLRPLAFPFIVVGMNSIAMYVISGLVGGDIRRGVEPFIQVTDEWYLWLPFFVACAGLCVKWYFCYWLYKHRIFIKV
jgi:heparan-alpha-glucosaminide N-acetyltransferase